MGYCAELRVGEPIIIPAENIAKFVAALPERVSWCDNTIDYPCTVAGADDLLSTYGFITERGDHVTLLSWGGDKIGWSWDEVWDAIGVASPTVTTWILEGEDGGCWAERLTGSERRCLEVTVHHHIHE